MRVFWILLSLIITGSGIAVFMPQGDRSDVTVVTAASESVSTPSNSYSAPSAITETPAAQLTENETSEELVADIVTESDSADTDVVIEDSALVTADSSDAETAEVIDQSPATEIAEAVEANETETDAVSEADANVSDSTEEANGWAALAEQANSSDSPTSTEADQINSSIEAEAEAEADAGPAPMTIARNEDGSLSIGGGKFTITGKGTKQSPYMIPWEYFVSIQEYYNPREGNKEIPGHIAMFDGAYVSIAGYLQFPLASPNPTECLVMLNQWDGCCIGVPPTPYDAIEVSLSEPATRAQKFSVEGRIVGKLKVDPYLVGNWLIGLYLLGDASVDVSGSRSAEEVYGNTPSQLIPHND